MKGVQNRSLIVCLDLEGVLVPEIWIKVAKKTGVDELKLTTREIPDYDALMKTRISILRREKIKLALIQKVITGIKPLPGAATFLHKLRRKAQVIILSDTFYEFAAPLMEKLSSPTLFCNRLSVDRDGYISGYQLRQKNGKQLSVQALKSLQFQVHASGDSYNDITMLKASDKGILFNPPPNIVKEFPQFRVARKYPELFKQLIG